MAIIKTGPGIANIRGSTGNKTYSEWKGKSYIRSKSKSCANPRSPDQAKARADMTELARAWSSQLTDPQRARWETYAQKQAGCEIKRKEQALIIPYKGYTMSGYNSFVGLNRLVRSAGIYVAGEILNYPPTDGDPLTPPMDLTCDCVFGGPNNRVEFSLGTSHITCGNVLAYTHLSAMSWAFWVQFKTLPAFQVLLSKAVFAGPPGGYEVLMSTSSMSWLLARQLGVQHLAIITPAMFSAGPLYRVVNTYDGSNTAAGLHTYVNGANVVPLGTTNLPIVGSIVSTTPLLFGNRVLGVVPSNCFMDEVINWNIELTPAQALADYAGAAGQCYVAAPSIQGIWHMNQAAGALVPDSSGNDFNGAFGGAPLPTWGASTKSICFAGDAVRITWTDPIEARPDTKIRIWLLSYDGGARLQKVASVALGVEVYDILGVRVSKGNAVPIKQVPGHYRIQIDAIDGAGKQSAPSNLCTVTVE